MRFDAEVWQKSNDDILVAMYIHYVSFEYLGLVGAQTFKQ